MRLDPETGLKVCTRCKKSKPAEAFGYCERGADKLQPWCRRCYSAYEQDNRAEILAKRTQFRHDNQGRTLLKGCRKRARLGSFLCSITEVDICMPDNCPICGHVIEKGNTRVSACSPSVDRYDLAQGYVPGNVWVICYVCNRRKGDMSGDELLAFAFKVIDAFKEHHAGLSFLQAARGLYQQLSRT